MKDKFSMFQVNFKTNKTNFLTVFAIPKHKEGEFISKPELLRKSLDAKELYCIENSEYEKNVTLHDAQIDKQFDHYVTYMMGSVFGYEGE